MPNIGYLLGILTNLEKHQFIRANNDFIVL
jgi:hypothetical protein